MGTGHTPSRAVAEYWVDCVVPWVTTPDATSRPHELQPLMETEQRISELGLASSAAVLHPPGTVMLSRTASVGYSLLIGREMATTQAFVTWHPGSNLDPTYLLLVLRAMAPEWERLAYGSTHLTIYMPDLESLRIPLPPLHEQRRIVEFVVAETGRLDAVVRLRENQGSLMTEALHAEAARLTGRWPSGFRSSDPWTKIPMRRVVERVRTGVTPVGLVDEPLPCSDSVPWHTPASLPGDLTVSQAESVLPAVGISKKLLFPPGTILLVGIGESLGKIGILEEEATANQQITAISISPRFCSRFFAWQLFAANQELREWAQHSRVRIINNDALLSFPVFAPEVSLQREVSLALDRRLGELRELGEATERFRRVSAERRQALIAAAVTGQIDVTTARGIDV